MSDNSSDWVLLSPQILIVCMSHAEVVSYEPAAHPAHRRRECGRCAHRSGYQPDRVASVILARGALILSPPEFHGREKTGRETRLILSLVRSHCGTVEYRYPIPPRSRSAPVGAQRVRLMLLASSLLL